MPSMDPETAILIILFLVCTLYAIILEQIHDKYVPKWLWLTVVIGNGLVFGALWAMEVYGVPLSARLVLAANAVGGTPIIIWQLWQNYWRAKEMRGGQHQ